MELASVATTEELATVALTEAMVATLGATGPTEATMAREMLSPRLLPKLRLTLTTAPTAMVDTDCLTDAPAVDTAFLTVAGMAAADSTAAATTARGKLRLTPPSARGVRTRGGLLTGAATATATATATSPPTPGATPDPTQSPTGPTVPAATALLTTVTTTERRQH